MSTPALTQSLFEQLGGKPAVDAVVDLFYQKVLADDRINYFFRRWTWGSKEENKKHF